MGRPARVPLDTRPPGAPRGCGGYAFNAAITSQGIDLVSLLQTEVIRAVLAPAGQVLWTALVGAVLFGVTHGRDRFRWSWWIPGTLVEAALLHGLWDSMSTIASTLALILTGNALVELQNGFISSTTASAVESLSVVLYIVGLAIVSAAGVLALFLVLRHYRKSRAAVEMPLPRS